MTVAVPITIIAMGLATFLLRYAFVGVVPERVLPTVVRRGLAYVVPALLMAFVVPGLVQDSLAKTHTLLSPYLVGTVVGVAVGLVKRNSFLLIFLAAMAGFVVSNLLMHAFHLIP